MRMPPPEPPRLSLKRSTLPEKTQLEMTLPPQLPPSHTLPPTPVHFAKPIEPETRVLSIVSGVSVRYIVCPRNAARSPFEDHATTPFVRKVQPSSVSRASPSARMAHPPGCCWTDERGPLPSKRQLTNLALPPPDALKPLPSALPELCPMVLPFAKNAQLVNEISPPPLLTIARSFALVKSTWSNSRLAPSITLGTRMSYASFAERTQ